MSVARSPTQAAVTVSQRADGSFHMRLVVQKDGLVSERELVARSCQDLAGVAAVNIALLLEDPAPLEEASTAPIVTPTPLPAASARTSAVASAPPAPDGGATQTARDAAEGGTDVRVLIQAPSLSLSLGPLPAPSAGFSLAAGVMLEPWYIVAGGTMWLAHASASTRPDTSAELDRLSASARICRSFGVGPIGLAPCLSVSAEHLRAQGAGPYVRAASADTTWLAAGAGLQARYRLTPWLNVLCSADLKLQTARPSVSIEGIGPLAELAWLGAELSLGSEWIL